jgi:sugar O-acyltransferase (sialic acid O-acetyltransferase NeuD family)
MTRAEFVVVGAGGAGVEAAWIASQMSSGPRCLGFLDDNPQRWGHLFEGLPILGGSANARELIDPTRVAVHVAVGKAASRKRVAAMLGEQGFTFVSLVHPSAVVASSAVIGDGVLVGPQAVIAPLARVGDHALVNSHAGVGHHAVVGAFTTVCPGVRVSGSCRVGEGVFLGSNAVILPKMEVGDGATVAANSMVVRRVAPLHTVMGVPARIVSKPAASESTAHP